MSKWQVGNNKVSLSTVAISTLAMVAATGLGVVPFFFVEFDAQLGRVWYSGWWHFHLVLQGVSILDIKGAKAAKAILVVGIMTLHSFGEGSSVGVSFADLKGLSQGLLVTLAIAVHNILEGLAVSMVLALKCVSPQVSNDTIEIQGETSTRRRNDNLYMNVVKHEI